MIKLFLFVIVCVLSLLDAACKKHFFKACTQYGSKIATAATSKASAGLRLGSPDLDNYIFLDQEDFNGTSLDTAIWTYYPETIIRGFARELQSNIEVSAGTLKIYARRTNDTVFSAGMITTQQSFNQRYGYFEIRAKVNAQVGPHSAFWVLQESVGAVNQVPNPSIFGTEIDIFEYHRAAGTENLYFGLHWNGYNFTDGSHQSVYGSSYTPGISSGFHNFGLEWTPKEYIVYVDGIEKARSSIAVSHIPEYLLLSTEINGYGGDRFQMSTTIPDTFEVDYVKVYTKKPCVTLYGACDYYGWVSSPLQPGNYTRSQLELLGVLNNDASSIEVPQGWTVTAYDNDNFSGNAVIVTADTRCASAVGFDNRLSSLKITAP